MGNVCSVFSNGGPHLIQLLGHLAMYPCGLVMSCLGGMALFQSQLLFHYMSQQFGLCFGGLFEQFPALDKTYFKGIYIFGHYLANDVLQTDTRVLQHQEIIEEGAQLVIIVTRGIGPSPVYLMVMSTRWSQTLSRLIAASLRMRTSCVPNS